MLVLLFLGILLTFLVLEGFLTSQRSGGATIDNTVLDDQMLAYHLDWNTIRDQKLLTYLYVKKVNAVVRYQNLAGVDYEQARHAIEHLLAHPELLPEIPQKRRPALPEAEDRRLQELIARGELVQATLLYANLLDVDQFTAQQVVERMEREQYLESIHDADVQRLLIADDEVNAVAILRKRYGLTQNEAIHAIDAMTFYEIND
jgi:hypothetical protein